MMHCLLTGGPVCRVPVTETMFARPSVGRLTCGADCRLALPHAAPVTMLATLAADLARTTTDPCAARSART